MNRSLIFGLGAAVLAVSGGTASLLVNDTGLVEDPPHLLTPSREVHVVSQDLDVAPPRQQPIRIEALDSAPAQPATDLVLAQIAELDKKHEQLELDKSRLREEVEQLDCVFRGCDLEAAIRWMLRTEFDDLYAENPRRYDHIDRLTNILFRLAVYTATRDLPTLRRHASDVAIRQLAARLPALRQAARATPRRKTWSYLDEVTGRRINREDIGYPRWEGDVRVIDWMRDLDPRDPRCAEASRLRRLAGEHSTRVIQGILGLPIYDEVEDEW